MVSKEQLESTAEEVLRGALKLPDVGRHITKQRLNGEFAESWEAQAAQEAKFGWGMLSSEATVKALGAALERLQSRGKPKPKL